MTLVLIWWAVASAGHVVLLAAILNRLQGYAIPPSILHPLEKLLLLVIAAVPLAALLVVLVDGAFGDLTLATIFRSWALASGVVFLAWTFLRLSRQIVRMVRRGPPMRRRRESDIPRDEAFHRDRLTWRLATALPGNEALKLWTVRTSVDFPRATKPREPLVIVHLSDFHLCGTLSKAFYRRAIEAALAERPHAFFLTGDLVESEECLDWVDELFRPLTHAAPTWFVLGNHDAYLPRPETLVERLEQAGLRSLMGREERARLGDWSVRLVGDSAPWFAGFPSAGEPQDPSEREPDLTIGLMHTPDRWYAARERGVDLALAGHTHGGQIRLPIFGPLFCPSRHGTRFSRGWYASGDQKMFVSQGIAGVIPVRFLCPPEIVQIEALSAHALERRQFDAALAQAATAQAARKDRSSNDRHSRPRSPSIRSKSIRCDPLSRSTS